MEKRLAQMIETIQSRQQQVESGSCLSPKCSPAEFRALPKDRLSDRFASLLSTLEALAERCVPPPLLNFWLGLPALGVGRSAVGVPLWSSAFSSFEESGLPSCRRTSKPQEILAAATERRWSR